nr:MAG TPA: hypothetical protein [Caudoviricetes sp.]
MDFSKGIFFAEVTRGENHYQLILILTADPQMIRIYDNNYQLKIIFN